MGTFDGHGLNIKCQIDNNNATKLEDRQTWRKYSQKGMFDSHGLNIQCQTEMHRWKTDTPGGNDNASMQNVDVATMPDTTLEK